MKWVLIMLLLNPNVGPLGDKWSEVQRTPELIDQAECQKRMQIFNMDRDLTRGGRVKFDCQQATTEDIKRDLFLKTHKSIVGCMERKGEDAAEALRRNGVDSPLAYVWHSMRVRLSLDHDGKLRSPPIVSIEKPWRKGMVPGARWSVATPPRVDRNGKAVERMEDRDDFSDLAIKHTASIIEACQPFSLPTEYFELWKELDIDFTENGYSKSAQ